MAVGTRWTRGKDDWGFLRERQAPGRGELVYGVCVCGGGGSSRNVHTSRPDLHLDLRVILFFVTICQFVEHNAVSRKKQEQILATADILCPESTVTSNTTPVKTPRSRSNIFVFLL